MAAGSPTIPVFAICASSKPHATPVDTYDDNPKEPVFTLTLVMDPVHLAYRVK
jgi:hypothetical protein